ncbi:unnamed protein product [Closterium sp. NIES-53]
MDSLRVLAFDHEVRPVQFDTWLDDLQLYLLSDIKDGVSLFDHVSGAATALPTTADIAHYSSPATAALGRLLLPYLLPELSTFATVEDLVSHLRASDAHYRAAVPAEDHFLSLDPTSLTVDLLEQHLLAAETSAIAVGAARGTLRPPFFEGCSPSPLAPSYASAATADVSVSEDVGAASASAKRRSDKVKGGKGGGGGSGSSGGGGSGSSGGGSGGGGGGGGTGGRSGGSGGGGGGSGGSGGSGAGGSGTGGVGTGARRFREWFLRGASGGSCPYVIRTGDRAGQTCGRLHTQHRCFSRLDDAWCAEFGDDVKLSRWVDLLRSRIAIFDLDFDAILSAMYVLSVSAEGDCYRCVLPDPGIDATAVGASESGTLPGTTPAQALHTFKLDLGTSACFFRDSTTPTPLSTPVPVRLADTSGGPVVSRSSTVLSGPAVPSGSLSGLHLHSFSANLVAASCSCHLLSHQTLLWHHRLGHPSLPRLRGMHSRLLVSGLPRSLPPLPPSPAPPCLPCVEGRQRIAPHSSFPLMTAPLQTLHMDVWGQARVSGQSRERYLLLVVDDYTRYTTVFPLRSKGQVVDVLIPWIRTVRLQLRERFDRDLPVLRLHSGRGGEFSSNLLRDFCRGEGILQSFTLLDPPRQNGIAERRIGLVMEVARTSMIHAASPYFLWLFAVRYAAHQLNLWPRVYLSETSPTLRWTGEVGDASVFWFYHPTSRRVLPSQDITFDESVPFYRLFPYHSASPPPPPLFLALGPPPVDPLPPQGPAPSGAASGGAASGGAEPGGAESEGAETGGAKLGGVETGGAEPQGAASSGGSASASSRQSPQQLREWFVRRTRLRSGATGAGGAGGAGAGGAGIAAGTGVTGGTAATSPGAARTRCTGAVGNGGVEGAGAGGAGAGGTGTGGAGFGGTGVGGARGAGAVDPGGAVRPRPYFVPLLQQVLGTPSSTDLTPPLLCPPPDQSHPPLQPASPLPAPSLYVEQSGALLERREPASRPVSPVHIAHRVPRSRPPSVPGTHAMTLRPSSVPLRVPLPAPPESSLYEIPDPESDRARVASPTVSRLLAIVVTDPFFESAAASALVAELLDLGAACRLDYASALVAESASASPLSVGGESALGTDVLEDRQEDFECLAAAVPRFASMLLAPEGDLDPPDIPTPRSYAEAITGLYSSQSQAAMDAEMASWKSTGTYVDEVPPPGANIVDGMWIFKGSLHEEIWLRRPPGFTGSFLAGTEWSLRRPVYGFRQTPREWHDTLRTTLAAMGFTPSTADPSLYLRTDTSLPPFYVLVYVDDLVFATYDTEALTLVKSELQKRHTCTDLGELRNYLGLQVLQRFGFQFSSPQPTPLSTDHSLSAPPSDESVEQTGPYPELVGCLMYLMTCTRPDLACPLSLLARYVAPVRRAWGSCLEDGVQLSSLVTQTPLGLTTWLRIGRHRVTPSASVSALFPSGLPTRLCDAEIYAGAMAAQELRWLTYLLNDLGEQPHSPLILYVDNKAMIALCQEHRLEHRTKHIALRYFLARELQHRGQLRLTYVATRANTADIFTKALPPGDHLRFSTVLGLVATLPHLLTD